MFAYASAKSAVNAAVNDLAKELAPKGHRVNSIIPGWVKTPMTEKFETSDEINAVISRHILGTGTPEDVSKAVLFLLNDASSFLNGNNFVVDGGGLG